MTTYAAPAERLRVEWVDVVRGLAIALMLVDHVLAVYAPGSSLRVGAPWSITRLSLPLFMLAAAAVYVPKRSPFSRLRLMVGAVLELAVIELFGLTAAIGVPGIVCVIALLVLGLDLLHRFCSPSWWLLGALGLVQALYVPMPGGWTGYEPGLVLAWFSLGWMAAEGPDLPAFVFTIGRHWWARPLRAMGRFPLTWYVGHLAVLGLLLQAVPA